jgi:hypothetical protein
VAAEPAILLTRHVGPKQLYRAGERKVDGSFLGAERYEYRAVAWCSERTVGTGGTASGGAVLALVRLTDLLDSAGHEYAIRCDDGFAAGLTYAVAASVACVENGRDANFSTGLRQTDGASVLDDRHRLLGVVAREGAQQGDARKQ